MKRDEPRDLPQPEDLLIEIHAARMTIREYEARLDRLTCMVGEVMRRRYRRHEPPAQRSDAPPVSRSVA